MPDHTQLNLIVDADRKAEWESYADKHDRSLSSLVRLSVEREIAADTQPTGSGSNNEQLTELQSALADLTGKLDGLHDRLADLEQQVARESPEVRELASDVFAALPTEEEVIQATHEPVIDPDETDAGSLAQTGRPTHLAAYLGVEEVQVSEALQKLQEETAQVDSRTIDGHGPE